MGTWSNGEKTGSEKLKKENEGTYVEYWKNGRPSQNPGIIGCSVFWSILRLIIFIKKSEMIKIVTKWLMYNWKLIDHDIYGSTSISSDNFLL